MVKLVAGGMGTGKSRRLIEMANASVKTTDGSIVFIDYDNRHMYALHYDVRFIETRDFPLDNHREFLGFICGIMSRDSDIKEIYVDDLNRIIKMLDDEHKVTLCDRLAELGDKYGLDFILAFNRDPAGLPDGLKQLII